MSECCSWLNILIDVNFRPRLLTLIISLNNCYKVVIDTGLSDECLSIFDKRQKKNEKIFFPGPILLNHLATSHFSVRLDYLTGTLDWNTVTTFDLQITYLQLCIYAIKPTVITKKIKYTTKQKLYRQRRKVDSHTTMCLCFIMPQMKSIDVTSLRT